MNLWINSRATHWTGDGDLQSVYFWMLDGRKVSGDYQTEMGAKFDRQAVVRRLNKRKAV